MLPQKDPAPCGWFVIGSFLNISAVSEWLIRKQKPVIIVCAGWKGKINLEDTLFAGALVHRLRAYFEPACDAPLVAESAYLNAGDNLIGALEGSSHVNRLKRLNIIEDIRYCLLEDEFDVVPVVRDGKITAA